MYTTKAWIELFIIALIPVILLTQRQPRYSTWNHEAFLTIGPLGESFTYIWIADFYFKYIWTRLLPHTLHHIYSGCRVSNIYGIGISSFTGIYVPNAWLQGAALYINSQRLWSLLALANFLLNIETILCYLTTKKLHVRPVGWQRRLRFYQRNSI